jgi:uncharacterized protein (DUF983 family)
MPEFNTLLDGIGKQASGQSDESERIGTRVETPDPLTISRSAAQAIVRGIRCKCPRCGQARFFGSFLKPVMQCPVCKQDWTCQRADDFPAYVSILLTGHVMVPFIVLVARTSWIPLWGQIGSAVCLAGCLMLALLQPAKGAIIAILWWFEMDGFKRN